ncbi:MAG: aromatic ring-hydroxylating dioxygenase subunit alpha [Acidobacteria bacterium]|nr:aromatic ring-hydroxylating dioxygenase subunit alpha [Acidobacteriota bacterium]
MNLLNFDFDERIEYAKTLPARCYTEADFLVAEQQRIFNRTWQLVGRLEQVAEPGAFFTAEVGDEPIVIVRSDDGELRGFHNVCRHRAGPIAQGQGSCNKFRCGYHGWTYSTDGRLIGVPDFDGVENFDRDKFGLRPVQVETWEQFIFAKLDGRVNAFSLRDFLEDIPGLTQHCRISEMKFAERRDYLIDCNWKVYVDNYAEGYHVPIVHPSLMREIDFQRYRTITRRFSSLQDAPIKTGDDPERRYSATTEQSEALYFWVFPNLMLNIYPDNLSTNLIVPVGHDKTLTIFEWYFHDVESAVAKERIKTTVDLSDEIQQEDIWICEQVQRRLKSVAYDRGRYSVKRENGVHQFHSLWMEFMKAN